MKLLLLTPQLPYPPHQGTSLRNYHILRGLAERHQITLLSFVEPSQTADPAVIQPLLDLCQAIEMVPVPERSWRQRLWQLLTTRQPDMAHRLHSPRFNRVLRRLLAENEFDLVQIEGIELASAIKIIRVASKRSRIVFDNHNAETALQRRNFLTDGRLPQRWPAALYSWVQIGRLRRFERWACTVADAVTAVSEPDGEMLRALAPGVKHLAVIPNCIDVASYAGGEMADECVYDVVFSGKMDYRPNVDAVLWFADNVWPLIQAQRPGATWAIVGQKPHTRLDRLRPLAGVTVTGWVASVQPYLVGARVCVMPFRIGSGTRLKLIEAMAAGKAIVSTAVGAEGFPVTHEAQLLLADTAAEVATAVVYLLQYPDERQRLGQAARQFSQAYDWRVVVPRFDVVYQQIMKTDQF